MRTSQAPAPVAAREPSRPGAPRPAVVALLVGATAAGALAIWQPLVGLGLALVLLVATLIRGVPVRRLGPVAVILTALAAIGGPNLAAPPAPWLFLFRVLIVLLGLAVVGYLLMDGRLALPAGLPRPAGILGVWVCWALLSIGWAENVVAALRWSLFMAMMAGLAIGIALICRDRRRARVLLWSLLGAFAVAFLIAVGEFATGLHLPTFRPNAENRGFLIGVGSLFGNQNNFAAFLSLSLPYFAVLPVVFRDARLRLLGFGGGAAALFLVLATGSKSGLLASGLVIAGLLVFVGLDRRGRGRLLVACVIAVLAVALVVPIVTGGGVIKLDERTVGKLDFGNLVAQLETGSGSGGVRAALLNDGLDLVAGTEGLGVGAGNAETRVQELQNAPVVPNLHNWWLEVLVNLGLVGFALYVLFYLTLLRRQLRVSRRSEDPLVRYMALAGALGVLGWALGSIGPSTAIHFAPMWIVFGLGMGALVLARREESRSGS